MKKIDYICFLIVILTLVIAGIGIFYSTGGERFIVENIYGESVEIFGDGIYKYNSVLAAGANKGTDFIMIIVALLFAFVTIIRKKAAKYRYLHVGLLSGLLYYSLCLVFGVTFNELFLIYVLLFSCALFAMIFLLSELINEDNLSEELKKESLIGTAIFIIICAFSVLVWLPYIIPALIAGQSFEIYTTEPTFVIDFGIILPVFLGCGIGILRKESLGYKLAPIPLTLMPIIGFVVIGQSIFQTAMGIDIPIKELIGLVISFIVLGAVAIYLNRRFLKHVK
ncbi:hypothetical protein EDC18_103308 [Natranaerovirga pectinivora]|uniref:Uncharacterized protein n=1 Tax=Natranaerovirga pectinivora TaxID=682400 RepID=A0A4V6NZU2_9FIRM|nr:hypothetical protein [Natranaerovirga pectinivora]TCT15600.1 hypothetical protein EDC18_103308 [Natranaerovirga pectinivora]